MKKLSIPELNTLVQKFAPIKIWYAGLVQGSLIYFEMKDQIPRRTYRGKPGIIGSAYMSIWGDYWCIKKADEEILNSGNITRENFNELIRSVIVGGELINFTPVELEKKLLIVFSNNYHIEIINDPNKDNSMSELFELHLPEGTIVSSSIEDGIYICDEINKSIAEHWPSKIN